MYWNPHQTPITTTSRFKIVYLEVHKINDELYNIMTLNYTYVETGFFIY